LQELVREFNFHRYDNLKHAANKKDPRRHKFETKGLSIVNLLFSAASGDVTAMRRLILFPTLHPIIIIHEFINYFKIYNLKHSKKFCKFLFSRHRLSGMDMTLSDYDGRTALHLAAAEGHFECVQFLVEQCSVPCSPKDR